MEQEAQLNYQEILSLLKESNKQFDSEIYIPSLNKEIHTKPMNAVHLKNIIRTALSGVFIDNQFNQVVYTILRDVLDPSIPFSNITTLDKILILLTLRKLNVKDSIDVELSCGDNKQIVAFDIDKILNKCKKQKFKFDDVVVESGTYSININFPSLDEEFLFDRDFDQNKIKKMDDKNKENMKDIPGVMFMYYLAQFIKFIKIGDVTINLAARTVQERINIIEPLPSTIINKVIEKIDEEFGQQINKILTVEKNIDGEGYRGLIEISPALFS
jgi:hypothetical protein